jgi:hypothetical protein
VTSIALVALDHPYGGGEMHLCQEHLTEVSADDTSNVLWTMPVDLYYARGYVQGAGEAELVALTTKQMVCLVHEDELPDDLAPRTPMTGEWSDEDGLDWSDDDIDQYRAGFDRGWAAQLNERAGRWYEDDYGRV